MASFDVGKDRAVDVGENQQMVEELVDIIRQLEEKCQKVLTVEELVDLIRQLEEKYQKVLTVEELVVLINLLEEQIRARQEQWQMVETDYAPYIEMDKIARDPETILVQEANKNSLKIELANARSELENAELENAQSNNANQDEVDRCKQRCEDLECQIKRIDYPNAKIAEMLGKMDKKLEPLRKEIRKILKKLRHLKDKLAALNGSSQAKYAAMSHAIDDEDFDMIAFLIGHNCPKNSWHLRLAAKKGNTDIVQLMIESGYELKDYVIEQAIENEDFDMVAFLINHNCPKDSWNLRLAAKKGNTDIVQLMIESGYELKDYVIEQAIENEDFDMVAFLINHNCPKDSWHLSLAAKKGNLEIIKLMIESGGYVLKEYVIEQAIENNDVGMVAFLIKHNCPIDSWNLRLAAKKANTEILELMIESGYELESSCY
jgi:hypothetical protein